MTTRATAAVLLLLVVVTLGMVVWSEQGATNVNSLRGGQRQRDLQTNEETATTATTTTTTTTNTGGVNNIPKFLDGRTSLQLAYENVDSLSPTLFQNMIWTFGNSEEELSFKKEHFYKMIRYHTPMGGICLHKSFYTGIQLLNPSVYNEVRYNAEQDEWQERQRIYNSLRGISVGGGGSN